MAEKQSEFFQSGNVILKRNLENAAMIEETLLKMHAQSEAKKTATTIAEQEKRTKAVIDKRKLEETEEYQAVERLKQTRLLAEEQLIRIRMTGTQEEIARAQSAYDSYYNDLMTAEKRLSDYKLEQESIREDYAKKARDMADRNERQHFAQMTLTRKLAYVKQNKEELVEKKKTLDKELKLLEQLGPEGRTGDQEKEFKEKTEERDRVSSQIKLNDEREEALSKANTVTSIGKALENPAQFGKQQREEHAAKAEKHIENSVAATARADDAKAAREELKEYANLQKAEKQLQQAEKNLKSLENKGTEAERRAAQEEYNNALKSLENSQQYQQLLKEEQDARKEAADEAKAAAEETKKSVGGAALQAVGNMINNVGNQIESNVKAMFGDQARMMGRLQGSIIDWSETVSDVSDRVGFSGAISQKDIVAKMVQLVDAGVAYNLEMRAFLAETSENIASTFNAFDSNLLRLIRIQQADTTAARLGMEASLTKLFNKYFNDTSYLTDSGAADNITGAIMDASATMSKNDALAFEFNVQKWLGSLYSIGASSEAVSKIATGINYLATGNVSALSNDASLQTLFAMSAAKAGKKSYAEMLLGGLTADDTNDLLRAMIEYLAEIAESQENYVTKSAYAELFGMSITDLNTFTGLKETEIANLYKEAETYKTLSDETEKQVKSIYDRLHLSQIIDTAIDNAMVGAAANIGQSAGLYGTWKATEILKGLVGEVKIPGIIGFGTGISSGLDLLNIAQTVIAGFGLIGSLLGGIGSAATGGALKMSKWNFKETNERGNNLSLITSGTSSGVSLSAKLGAVNASGEDSESVTLETAEKKGKDELDKIKSEELEENNDIYEKIYEAIADNDGNTVLKVLLSMAASMQQQAEAGAGDTNTDVTTNNSVDNITNAINNSSSSMSSSLSQAIDEVQNSNTQSSLIPPETNVVVPDSSVNVSSPEVNVDNTVVVPQPEVNVTTQPIVPPPVVNVDTSVANEDNNSDVTSIYEQLLSVAGDSLELYAKMYDAIAEGESVNVLSVLQEINDKLSLDRVFYTAITSVGAKSTVTAGSIMDMSAQLHASKLPIPEDMTARVESDQDRHNHRKQHSSMLGGNLDQFESNSIDLELLISTAVETALRNIAGYSSGTGLPVVVTNMNNFGG